MSHPSDSLTRSVLWGSFAHGRMAPLAPLHLRVFLASPGDVAEERTLAVQVLDNLCYIEPRCLARP
jgi:hypothetical protein